MQHIQTGLLYLLILVWPLTGALPATTIAAHSSHTFLPPVRTVSDPESGCGTPGGPTTCFAYLPLIMRPSYHLIHVPIGFNSGGGEALLPDGRRFLEDQAHSAANGAGYIDGQAVASDFEWEPIDGVDNDSLYLSARTGMSAYRFNLTNGFYVVELHLAEIRHHGPGFRVFDVAIEGQSVADGLDIYALAQHDYALRLRFAAEVRDRQLDVAFTATAGQPLVSAIWVDRSAPDSQPPAAPAGLQVVGGYRRAIVRWQQGDEMDIAGYRVYRAPTPTGPFQAINATPTPLARFFDDAVSVGQSYCYRVTAVDIYSNEGAYGPSACAMVVDDDASPLPMLELTISPANLHALAADPFVEVEVPGSLEVDGQGYDVVAEYRGRTTQGSNKKSWKVAANQPLPAWQQDMLLLNGEGYDHAMIREKVAYDLFEAAGVQPLQTRFVHLNLNDEFIGVFTQLENPDNKFLQRTGRNPDGNVFKCLDGFDVEPDCTNEIVEGRGMTDLYTFAAIVNRTADAEFASAIADVLDVRGFLDYQAIKSVTGDHDATYQYLLYHDPDAAQWQVLPWDNNLAFYMIQLPVDYGTAENPAYNDAVNVLLTRVLRVPQYRRYYGERLLELTQGLFSSAAMRDRFDAAKTQIWYDAQRDVWKRFREDNDAFAIYLSYLPEYVNRRIDFLRTAVPAYMPAESRFIALNELMANNSSTIVDPADGQAEPWFEIANAGLTPIDIGGMYLTDSLAAPTRYRIPAQTLPPLGSLLFWADGESSQGPTHVNFTLPANGGQIYLIDRNGSSRIDAVSFPSLPANVSFGRFPDQSGPWQQFRQPTPSQPNRLLPPTISDVIQTPLYPRTGDVVTVTAVIVDDGSVSEALLIYGHNEPTTPLVMFDDGNHGDGDASDGRYGAQIPPLPNGATVKYYLQATDDYSRSSLDPFAAPVLTHSYRVGYQPLTVALSEFMAANTATVEDPDEPGEYPDWIELANSGTEPVSLNGFYLTDDLQQPWKHRIGAGVTVPPGGAIVFWADDDPEQGPLHTTFKLSKEGEAIGLFDRDGVTPIDTLIFPAQSEDVSYGRCQVSGGPWEYLYVPTPGQANACHRQYLPVMRRQ